MYQLTESYTKRLLLRAEDIDLVDICTPTYLHESHFAEAIKAGKHIFCEKPLARTLDRDWC